MTRNTQLIFIMRIGHSDQVSWKAYFNRTVPVQ